MGIKLISKGSVAPWNSKVIPPVTRGLQGWFTFDTDVSRFALNRAPGKPDAVMIGNPTAFTTHGRFKGLVNFLETQFSETVDQTIIVVGKAVSAIPANASATGDANTPAYAGNYYGSSATEGFTGNVYGSSLFHSAPATLSGNGARSGGVNNPVNAIADLASEVPTAWGIRAIRVAEAPGTNTVFNLTRGVSSSNALITSRVLAATKLRIGSAHRNFGGEVDISVVAVYAAALTDAEITQVAEAMRKRMARFGITV
jgi:hypothetical protein